MSYGLFSYINFISCTPRFLYILYISVDANFKLKGKERNLKDIELMPGWGAYVPDADFKEHIANNADEPEVCTCQSSYDISQCLHRLSTHVIPSTTPW